MLPRARARAAFAAAILLAGLTIGVAPVAAVAQTPTVDRTLVTGSIDMGTGSYSVPGGTITVNATGVLSQPIRESLSFDDANVRQGRSIDLARTVAVNGAGSLAVVWTVSGLFSTTATKTVPCTVGFTAFVTCNATSSSIRLLGQIPIPATPIIDVELQASVTVTPQEPAAVRAATLSGGTKIMAARDASIPGTQAFAVPCNTAVGDTLAVDETDFANAIGVASSNGPAISVGAWIPIPLPPFVIEGPSVTTAPSPATGFVNQALRDAPSQIVPFGIIKPNNVPPVADAGPSPYSGAEGTPLQFDGSATSALCGPPALRWDFSDGGVAFGPKPFHTFQGPGIYSGQLTATDATGLVRSTIFSVEITNLPPVVTAGPDTTAAWGRPVAFNGSAVDPGANDQSTLTYSWDFGDGTPSAAGGPSVYHSYATPGNRTSTLTVCDQWGGCDSSSRIVHVRARDVTAAYLGDTTGTFDTGGMLSASLTDEFGQAVSGRSVNFFVNGGLAGSATTGAGGSVFLGFTPELAAGPYATSVSFVPFAGDTLYNSASATGSILIAKKTTSVTYTGAISGGPNKTVTLSAILRDATGTALAGRSITFKLGTQSVTAVTGSTGVATTTLNLAQKNGKYSLTATYTPTNTATTPIDANAYVGSASATSFSLGGKSGK